MQRAPSTPNAFRLALALVGTVTACPNSPPAVGPDTYDAAASILLELGTGRNAFEAVAPVGSSVELVHGPQGGYHIYGRYRFRGFTPDVYVSFRLTPVEGGAPVNNPADRVRRLDQHGLQRVGEGWEAASPELVILTTIRGPGEVIGHRFRWEVFVRSAATGQVATAERDVTIVDDVP